MEAAELNLDLNLWSSCRQCWQWLWLSWTHNSALLIFDFKPRFSRSSTFFVFLKKFSGFRWRQSDWNQLWGQQSRLKFGQKWWRSVKKKGGEGGKRTKDRCKFICDKKKQKCQTSPILLETVFGSFPLWCYFILAIVTQFTIIELYLLTHPATKMWILSPVFDDLRCYGKLGSRDFAWNFFWK